jgi:hypothetical protein
MENEVQISGDVPAGSESTERLPVARAAGWLSRLLCNHRLLLEIFVLANLTFLAPDIYLAHSTNSFRHPGEYLPLWFSMAAPLVLLVAILALEIGNLEMIWRRLGLLAGGLAVVLGIAGLILHLESHFFREMTLESLVYTAPFAAPLAYTGIGLLLIMNRMVDRHSVEWPLWVLLLALGGFVGNFIFSLADHAQNGFYHASEWIPVISSAFAISFLLIPFLVQVNRSYLLVCTWVMILQVAVGITGFVLHNRANLNGPSARAFDNFVYGAPPLAPLLFPNLALLTFLGLWTLRGHLPVPAKTRSNLP